MDLGPQELGRRDRAVDSVEKGKFRWTRNARAGLLTWCSLERSSQSTTHACTQSIGSPCHGLGNGPFYICTYF